MISASHAPVASHATKRDARGLGRLILDHLTFLHTPIRRKFALFSLGVSFWFVVLAGAALLHAPTRQWLFIVGALVLALALLVLFTFSITRSLTKPIDEMIEQIRGLTGGDMETLGHITISSGDEVGELSARFNTLLDSLREIGAFKKVIESDDGALDVYARLARAFEASSLSHRVFSVDAQGKGMTLAITSPDAEEWCKRDILDDSNLCRARRTGAVVSSLTYPGICQLFAQGQKIHVCLPLNIGGSTGGVVQFVSGPAVREDTFRARVATAERFVKEALPVLEAKRLAERLRDSAMRDPMTGLHNRRFLEEMQGNLIAMAQRRGVIVGVVLLDVDHFKAVNDEHGHAVGDVVLKDISRILLQTVRASDIVIRYGGEEFLLVLQETLADGIGLVAERLRANIEAHEFTAEGVLLKKTASMGTAAYPADSDSFWQCVKLADQALYEAKTNGRNRVVRWCVAAPAESPTAP